MKSVSRRVVVGALSATVVSEAPYSGFLQLRCNVSICTGQLPIVRATERLVMQHISCTADVSKESIFREFYVQVTDSAVTKQRSFHFLPPTYESDRLMQTVVYGLGQPITLVAGPDSMVHLGAMAMGTMSSARCAVTGVKQKLG